jgi:hypothetical protein
MLRIRDAQLPAVSGPYAGNGAPGGWVEPKPRQPLRMKHSDGSTYVGWIDPATEPALISPPPTRRP